MNDAQLLRSAHPSWPARGAFKRKRIFRVSGVFRRQL
jgi:hypothetical protein